jgi:phosphoglycerate dehydrogenase-like enzyme
MALNVWVRLPVPEDEMTRLREQFPDVTFHQGTTIPDKTMAIVDAALVEGYALADDEIDRMPKLRWLQCTHAGAAMLLTPPVRERRIKTSSGRGLHSVPFAELTVAYIFAMAKHIPVAVMAQSEHRWVEDLPYTLEVRGKTLGLVGFGNIGSEIAKMMHGLGLRIIATRLHPDREKPDYVDWIRGPEAFNDLLRESDFVVLAMAASPETQGIINEDALSHMKPTAYLFNLASRTAAPDEEIVAKALREGRLGGAMFNVFPGFGKIADNSPLWDAPNFHISPFLAALDPREWERATSLFARNLGAFMEDRALENEIDVSTY